MPDWAQPGARCTMSIEPAIAMRTAAFDWDYEVQVALPASYGVMPDKRYPVLWLTDGPFLLHLAVGLLNTLVVGGLAPEMIVVGVGCSERCGGGGVRPSARDRLRSAWEVHVFRRAGSRLFPQARRCRKAALQKADDLLAFLVDEVRPCLGARLSDE